MVQGVLEGADSSSIATQLFGTGVTPIEIGEAAKPATPAEGGTRSKFWKLRDARVAPVDLMLFSRQM